MKEDATYEVVKPIPLGNGKSIPVNTRINRTHGVYYMDGILLSPDYQQDFDQLIDVEERKGGKYLAKLRSRVMFRNDKEDI